MMNETIELTDEEKNFLYELKQKVAGKKTLAFAINLIFDKEEVSSLEDVVVALREEDIIGGVVCTKDTSFSFNKKHEISETTKASVKRIIGDLEEDFWPL